MRLFAALFIAAFSLLTIAPVAQAAPPKRDPLRIEPVRVSIAEGEAGIRKSGSSISWQRFANLRRGQSLDFWATGTGGDFTLRLVKPDGTVIFDAVRVQDPDAPKDAIVRGFNFKAPAKGRYMIQFITKASSKVSIQSHGYLSKPEAVTLPGTWSLDHEAMAFDMLNSNRGDLAELTTLTTKLQRMLTVKMTFKADGTWSAELRRPGQTQLNTGTWSRSGDKVTMITLTQNRKALPKDRQERETLTVEDGQLVAPSQGIMIYMDKVS